MMRSVSTRRRFSTAPLRRFLASLLVGLMLAPPVVWAGPSGEAVVRGDVTVVHDGADTTITAGNRSIIEWDNFDIGVGESVQFIQPNRRARVLNRVVGPNATYIEGELRANGTVYLLNKFGIFLGDTAVVEVANLIAGAGHLSNEDFLGGIDRFTELGGAVENRGLISGSSITLLGKSVANHGAISAPNGRIWMLAGDEVIVAEHGSPIVLRIGNPAESELTQYAVQNTGSLDAGNRGSVRMAAGDLLSLAIANSGTIRARDIKLAAGEGGRVQVGGTLDASNTLGGPNRDGGTVDIRGDYIFVDDATIDASGRRGGGTVHIGGAVQGALATGSSERNSQLTYISDDSIVRADALRSGDGGEIVAWSDGGTIVEGHLSARGAERSGNGGFVETSGKKFLSADVVPDIAAPNGQAGMWLIDPANIDIVALLSVPPDSDQDLNAIVDKLSKSDLASVNPTFLPLADSSEITADTLEAALGRGFNITISTQFLGKNSGANQEGNIVFKEGLDFNTPNTIIPGTTASLTLLAANRIEIEAGSGGINDSLSPNLALNLFLRAGDTNQPQETGFALTDSPGFVDGGIAAAAGMNESVEINDAITVRGGITLSGEDVVATSALTGESITINARHAVATTNMATIGDNIIIRAEQGSIDIVGAGGANPDIQTDGGSIFLTATGGDVNLAGSVDTRDDLTDNAANAPGGVMQIDAIPRTEFGDPEAKGGSINLTTIDADDKIILPTGLQFDAGDNMLVQQEVITNGGDATFRITDSATTVNIEDDDGKVVEGHPFVLGDQMLALEGDVTTNGGGIIIQATVAPDTTADVDIVVRGNLNALDPSLVNPENGNILLSTSGDLLLEDLVTNNIAFSGDFVQLSAGLDGSGDLDFNSPTSLSGRVVRIEAGDGYTATPSGTLDAAALLELQAKRSSAISGLSSVAVQGNGTESLESVRILQDAAFATGTLPTLDYTGTTAPELELSSPDGMIHVEAGSFAAVTTDLGLADLELSLFAAGGDGDNSLPLPTSDQIFRLDEELNFRRVDLNTSGTLVIDTTLADMASGANTDELHILAGRGAILPFDIGRQPTFAGVPGGLKIEDGVSLVANDVLEIRGAVNGVGDFLRAERQGIGVEVGDGVTLQANNITLRAGDGAGGANFALDGNGAPLYPKIANATNGGPVANLTIQNADTSDLSFTYQQESAIGVNDLPAITDVDSALSYTAISDEGQIAIGDTTVPILANKNVTLAARGYDFSLLTNPLDTLNLDIGGVTDFKFDNALLGNFNWANNDLTLRAATGVNSGGKLSFANGTRVSANSIRLVASDGIGGRNSASIDVGDATFTAVDTTAGPGTFVMEQDANLTSADLPDAANFGDASGNDLPGTLGLRSIDNSVQLNAVPTIFQNRLVLAGALVNISVEDGDLDLSTIPDLEIRADQIFLRAASKSASNAVNHRVLFDTATNSGKFFGYDDLIGGYEDGDLNMTARVIANAQAPEVFTVQQDTEIVSSALPDRAFFGLLGPEVNNGTLYRLQADQDASIDIDDAARVQGTSLELRLLNYDKADAALAASDANKRKIELGSTNPYVLQSLDISVPQSLTLTDIDIDAVGLVKIEAGTDNSPDGDLIFEETGAIAGNKIRATQIQLLAGSGNFSSIDTNDDGSQLAEIKIGSGTLDLTLGAFDPDILTSLTIAQDASLSTSNLIGNGFSVDPAKVNLDFLDLRSRRGKLSVDIDDVLNTESLLLSAGTLSSKLLDTDDDPLTTPAFVDDIGVLEIFSTTGDLDLGMNTTSQMTNINLNGQKLELRAESAGARLNIHSTAVRASGGTAALPDSVLFSQDAAFDFTDNSLLAEPFSNVLLATQYDGSVLGLDYTLDSRSGDFTVDAAMATQLSSFELTLDNETNAVGGPHTITLDPTLATSQRFFGLRAISSDVFINTSEFSTLSRQIYEAPVTFQQSSELLGLDLLFGDTVQASNAGIDVELYAGRKVQFAQGVGSSGGLNALAANNQLNHLSVFFLDQGQLEFGSATGDVLDVGEISDALADTSDTGVYLQGDLKVHTIDSLKFATQDTVDPTPRKPGSSIATIYKRGVGTLQVAANDVKFGDDAVDPSVGGIEAYGEKLTVLGTLDIDAVGRLVVGDLTADRIELAADSITYLKRPGASVRGPSGSVQRDTGVDWIANSFDLTTTPGTGLLAAAGTGRRLLIGTPGGRPSIDGVPIDAPLYAIKPNLGSLPASDLIYDPDGEAVSGDTSFNAAPVILDGKARGPSAADLSNSYADLWPDPSTNAPHGDQVVDRDTFLEVGITTRPASGLEVASRTQNRGIYDDASRAWRSDRGVAALTSARLDVPNATEAKRLFREVFGSNLSRAPQIREILAQAVADYQQHTGVQRVLGFELRRYLKNRPSTQFDAYQVLEELDRLFSAHRRSGLVPGEFAPVQRAWVEAITPEGITPDELGEAIQPSRYVRGSDVLDVFGD